MKYLLLLVLFICSFAIADIENYCSGFCEQTGILPPNYFNGPTLEELAHLIKHSDDDDYKKRVRLYSTLEEATKQNYKLTCSGTRKGNPPLKIKFELFVGIMGTGELVGFSIVKVANIDPKIPIWDSNLETCNEEMNEKKQCYKKDTVNGESFYHKICILDIIRPRVHRSIINARKKINEYKCPGRDNDYEFHLFDLEIRDIIKAAKVDLNNLQIWASFKFPLKSQKDNSNLTRLNCQLKHVSEKHIMDVFNLYAKK